MTGIYTNRVFDGANSPVNNQCFLTSDVFNRYCSVSKTNVPYFRPEIASRYLPSLARLELKVLCFSKIAYFEIAVYIGLMFMPLYVVSLSLSTIHLSSNQYDRPLFIIQQFKCIHS